MQKKHLIGYPLTALLALVAGAASGGGTADTGGAAPAPASATGLTVPQSVEGFGQTATEAPPTTSDQETSAAATAPKQASQTIPGDGTYEIGVDVQPGKYVSDAATSGNCYWARLKNDDPFDGILANNNSSGSSIVVIKKSDKYFQTTGCNAWTKR